MATEIPAMPSHLHFPPELWSITTRNFRRRKSPEELTYLWTTLRHVSRQFKQEIEDMFRTEHLPKTWLHVDTASTLLPIFYNPPNQMKSYDFSCKLMFEKIQPRYPSRAVFSLRSKNYSRERRILEISARSHKTFKNLRDKAGPGRLGEAEKSVPGSRIRLFESPVGMFVVQVRGSVGDCALPALNIDPSKHELSVEWRDLFNRFFRERKVATTVLHSAPIDQTPVHKRDFDPTQQDSAAFHRLTNQLNPGLQALAQLDWHINLRHLRVSQEGKTRIQRLKNPIQTWTDAMGDNFGQAKPTLQRCRLRRQADQEIDLDDEGNINQARLYLETEGNRIADSRGRAEWLPLTRDCDGCRTMNRQCERGDTENRFLGDCNSCIETGSLCDTSLACLNISRPHYVSQDYQMQLMLLEQHNKKRLLMARQEQDTMGQSSSQASHHAATAGSNLPSGNHALQNYQMHMMLLEAQNKKRLMARQQSSSAGLPPSHLQPNLSHNLHSLPWPNPSQDHELQSSVLYERNRQCLWKARQGPVDVGQVLRSGPSKPAPDNQAQLPVQTCEEQPQEARNDLGAFFREVQPQPLMARDAFSPPSAPTGEAFGHPDNHSQPAAPSHGLSSAVAPAVE